MVSVEVGIVLFVGWAVSDIGSQGVGSSYDYDFCVSNNFNWGDFIVFIGVYNFIFNNSDNFVFIGCELCNNGGIQACIEDVSGGYVGFMICESSVLGVKMVVVYFNFISLLRWEICIIDNGLRVFNIFFVFFFYWLRFVWQNDYIWVFYCILDNGSWIFFYQVYLFMQFCVEMGLAVFIIDLNGQVQVIFSQVQWQFNVGGNSLAFFNDGVVVVQLEEWEASVFFNLV